MGPSGGTSVSGTLQYYLGTFRYTTQAFTTDNEGHTGPGYGTNAIYYGGATIFGGYDHVCFLFNV